MLACAKKPSMSCSAFFVLILYSILSLFSVAEVRAAKQELAWCESFPLSIQLRRGDITGSASNSTNQSISISTAKSAQITIGTPIDLNIAADVDNGFNNVVTTDPSGVLWRATSEKRRGFKGNLSAEYVFSGLVYGDNKICSSPDSCLVVTGIDSIVQNIETEVKNNKITVITAEGRVRLTVDASQAIESGSYSANLSISIYDNGKGGSTLVECL